MYIASNLCKSAHAEQQSLRVRYSKFRSVTAQSYEPSHYSATIDAASVLIYSTFLLLLTVVLGFGEGLNVIQGTEDTGLPELAPCSSMM